MRKFIRKTSLICALMMILSASVFTNVSAAEVTGRDVRVNDYIWTIPRNFKVGDIVQLVGTTTNIGTEAVPQGGMSLENMKGCTAADGKTNTWLNSQTTMQPGETVEFSVPYLQITDTKISFTLTRGCDYDVNQRNNRDIYFEIESQENHVDLNMKNIRVEPIDFKAGEKIKVYADVENLGGQNMPYSNLEYSITYGDDTVKTKIGTTMLSNEIKELYFGEITAPTDKFNLTLTVNADNKVDENVTINNTKTYLVGSYETNSDYIWGTTGVTSGGYVTMGYADYKTNTMYARTDVGGGYVWNEDLKSWSQIVNAMDFMYNVQSGMNGFDKIQGRDDVLFMIAGLHSGGGWRGYPDYGYIARSMDGGKSWKPISMDASGCVRDGSRICLDQNNPNILYHVNSYGKAYVTENALDTQPVWKEISLPGATLNPTGQYGSGYENDKAGLGSVMVDTTSMVNGRSKNIYISSSKDGIFMSNDGGKTFRLMKNSPKCALTMKVDSKGNLYVATGITDLGLKKWDGKEWKTIFNRKGMRTSRVAVNPDNDNIIAVGGTTEVFLTFDGGETWKDMYTGATKIKDTGINDFSSVWSSTTVLEFDPSDTNKLWRGLCRCDDITASVPTWRVLSQGFEELCHMHVTAVTGRDYILSDNMDGDLNIAVGETLFNQSEYRHMDLTSMYEGVTHDFCATNPDFIVNFGGAGAWTLNPFTGAYTSDGGLTYTEMDPKKMPLKTNGIPDAFYNCAVSAGNNANGNPTIIGGGLESGWRSEDLGETWEQISFDIKLTKGMGWSWGENRTVCADPYINGMYYFYDMQTGTFMRSEDDGKSFHTVVKLPTSGNFIRAIYGHEGYLGLTMGNEGLWITKDRGETWEKCKMIDRAELFGTGAKIGGSEYDTLYVYGKIGEDYGFYMSTDMGETWTRINCPDYQYYQEAMSIDGDKNRPGVLYTATNGRGVTVLMPKDSDFRPVEIVLQGADEITVRDSLFKLHGSATRQVPLEIDFNGQKENLSTGLTQTFERSYSLKPGKNLITISGTNASGTTTKTKTVTYDPNYIKVKSNVNGAKTNADTYMVTGSVNCKANVTVGGTAAAIDEAYGFAQEISLNEGENNIVIKATDSLGNTDETAITVIRDTVKPELEFVNASGMQTSEFYIKIPAKLTKPAYVTYGGETTFYPAGEVAFSALLSSGDNTLSYGLKDELGNTNNQEYHIVFNAPDGYLDDHSMAIVHKGVATIDGKNSNDEWMLDRAIYRTTSSSSGVNEDYAYFGLKTDGKNLYVAAAVYDTVYLPEPVADTHKTTYDRDTVEFMVDPDGNRASTAYDSRDSQSRLHSNGIVWECQKNSLMTGAVSRAEKTDYGYFIEASIPLSKLNLVYSEGGFFNFEIAINDCDDENLGRTSTLGWCSDDNAWCNTYLFGTAVFE